mmetsp:Transcript_4928/g.18555  ORF Transcript_4928/g.18555 Transcript_4928/m.18555 type:complete len:366 (+) Transcript_4928:404-1501(+)
MLSLLNAQLSVNCRLQLSTFSFGSCLVFLSLFQFVGILAFSVLNDFLHEFVTCTLLGVPLGLSFGILFFGVLVTKSLELRLVLLFLLHLSEKESLVLASLSSEFGFVLSLTCRLLCFLLENVLNHSQIELTLLLHFLLTNELFALVESIHLLLELLIFFLFPENCALLFLILNLPFLLHETCFLLLESLHLKLLLLNNIHLFCQVLTKLSVLFQLNAILSHLSLFLLKSILLPQLIVHTFLLLFESFSVLFFILLLFSGFGILQYHCSGLCISQFVTFSQEFPIQLLLSKFLVSIFTCLFELTSSCLQSGASLLSCLLSIVQFFLVHFILKCQLFSQSIPSLFQFQFCLLSQFLVTLLNLTRLNF